MAGFGPNVDFIKSESPNTRPLRAGWVQWHFSRIYWKSPDWSAKKKEKKKKFYVLEVLREAETRTGNSVVEKLLVRQYNPHSGNKNYIFKTESIY